MALIDHFIEDARRAFGYLEFDFGFSAEIQDAHWAVRSILYRNAATCVLVELDSRLPAFNLLIGPLDEGELPTRPAGLSAGEAVGWFPLWLVIRANGEWPPDFTFSVRRAAFQGELKLWAEALHVHAGYALRGEFSELRDAAALLRARAELRAVEADALRQAQGVAGTRRALRRAS